MASLLAGAGSGSGVSFGAGARFGAITISVINLPLSPVAHTTTPAPISTAPVATGPGSGTSPGPVLTTNTPTFTWTAITGITGYQINLHNSTTNTSTSYQVGASVTSYTLPAGVLAAGDSYVWNVRGLNGTASGPPSNYEYFQAMPATTPAPTPALAAPVATGPGSGTSPGPVLSSNTPTFTWTAITGITGYQINLHNSTTNTSTSYQVGASVTSYTLPAGVLAAGDSYVWNVRGLNGTASGPPSNYEYFQAMPAATLGAPTAIAPGGGTSPGPVTSSTPTFSWTAVAGVTGYEIKLYDATAASSTTYTTDANTTSYTLASGVLVTGDKYVWYVRALNGSQEGTHSNELYFQAPLPAPLVAPVATGPGVSTSPGPVLTTLTPTFTWNAVAGATGYQVNLYDQTTAKFHSYQVDSSTTDFTVPTGVLNPSDQYVWNVRVLQGTRSGPPSVYLYFQTPSSSVAMSALTTQLKTLAVERTATTASIATATTGTARYDHLTHKLHDENKDIKSVRAEESDLKKA